MFSDLLIGAEKADRWRRPLVALFFSLLLLIGLLVHRDYGVSWDEPTDHLNGLVNVKYMAQRLAPERVRHDPAFALIPELQQSRDKDHGPAFEVLVVVLNKVLTDGDSRSYFFLRHLLIYLFFVAGAWALYQIGRIYLGSWRWGLLAAVLLVLSPRFFAEAFFNGKDIVFMAAFTVGVYTLLRLLRQPTLLNTLLHAGATAFAFDIRILAIVLVAFTVGLLALEAWQLPTERRRIGGALVLYLPLAACLMVLGWPYLWEAPVANFLTAFRRLSQYPWPFTTLYLGEFVPGKQTPWHYALVWMVVTTPLTYLVASLLGMYHAMRQGASLVGSAQGRLQLLLLGWLLGPILMVIVLKSVLYDSWRHLYFIYPALLLLAGQGLRELYLLAKGRGIRGLVAKALLLFGSFDVVRAAVLMVLMHPYQQVYFSFLPAATAERLFERDYWGLAFREGLEWIMAHDNSPRIPVSVAWHYPLYNNSLILKPADRARVQYSPGRNSAYRYYLTGYRWHPQTYGDSLGREVYTIRANGIKILSVFRREPQP